MNFDKIFIHPKYKLNKQYDDYDMAVLKFRETIKFFWHLRTICVPHHSKKNSDRLSIFKISLI